MWFNAAMDAQMTRRQVAWIGGSLFLGTAAAAEPAKPRTAIHQEIDYNATPERIYGVLLDARQFSAFTGQPAEIQPQPGGAFQLFGGRVEGRIVELVPNQRIVQAWRPASWPSGFYSIVRFELTSRQAGTRIILDHAGFTAEKWVTLNEGWREHYWEPLRKYLG